MVDSGTLTEAIFPFITSFLSDLHKKLKPIVHVSIYAFRGYRELCTRIKGPKIAKRKTTPAIALPP